MADCEKVCSYIDLPLQHASNPVLKRMKRPGTRQSYDTLLTRIRERVPGVALRTTFIVGFPGETEADVEELVRVHRRSRLRPRRRLHLLARRRDRGVRARGRYSGQDQGGTPQSGHEPPEAAGQASAARADRRTGAHPHRRALIRITISCCRGRLATQAPDIDASVFLTECDPSAFRSGDFVEVEIVGARDYDLIARPTILQPA